MEEIMIEKFYYAVRIIIKEQKVQSKKISELENKINITGNFKKDLNDEKKETAKNLTVLQIDLKTWKKQLKKTLKVSQKLKRNHVT